MLVYQRVFIVVSGILLRDLSGAGLFGVGCEERPWPRSVAWGMAQIPRERSVCSVLCWFQKADIVPAICDWLMQSSTYSTPMYLLRGATGHSPVWTPQAVWNLEDLIVHQDGHPLDRMGPQRDTSIPFGDYHHHFPRDRDIRYIGKDHNDHKPCSISSSCVCSSKHMVSSCLIGLDC